MPSVLNVSRAGFCQLKNRPLSSRAIREAWLTDLIAEIHASSRGTHGSPSSRRTALLGSRIVVGHNRVSRLMRTAGPVGLPLKRRFKNRAQVVTALDLVNRQFAMPEPK